MISKAWDWVLRRLKSLWRGIGDRWLVILFGLFFLALAPMPFLVDEASSRNVVAAAQIVTLFVVVWYTYETMRLRRASENQLTLMMTDVMTKLPVVEIRLLNSENNMLNGIFETDPESINVHIEKHFDGPIFNPVIVAKIGGKSQTFIFREVIAHEYWRKSLLEFDVARVYESTDTAVTETARYFRIPTNKVTSLITSDEYFLLFLFIDKFGRIISMYRPISGPLNDIVYHPFLVTLINRT